MSNFFAQPDALAYGKTLNDVEQEGVPEELRQHKVFAGNRPSSSILMTRLDAFAIGQLLAIYEHRMMRDMTQELQQVGSTTKVDNDRLF